MSIWTFSTSMMGIVNAQTNFSLNLFHDVIAQTPNESVLVAPLAISFLLSTILMGSHVESKNELIKRLMGDIITEKKWEASRYESGNNYYHHLTILLNYQKNLHVKLSMANVALFAELRNEFLDKVNNCQQYHYYKANFSDPLNLTQKVNDYVYQKTDKKIKNFIEPKNINSETFAMLLNGVFFKAKWDEKISLEMGSFVVMPGKKIQIQFMRGFFQNTFYDEDEKTKLIGLLYPDNKFCMYFFLPHKNLTLSSFLNNFKSSQFLERISNAKQMSNEILIPKFNTNFKYDLKDVMKGLLPKTFALNANFSDISTTNNNKNWQIVQKVSIEIDENRNAEPTIPFVDTPPFLMVSSALELNRPFAYYLVEPETNAIVLAGTFYGLNH